MKTVRCPQCLNVVESSTVVLLFRSCLLLFIPPLLLIPRTLPLPLSLQLPCPCPCRCSCPCLCPCCCSSLLLSVLLTYIWHYPMTKTQFMQKRSVWEWQFPHGCLDVFYRSWDKSRNPCQCRNHTFPNEVHHQNLVSTWPVLHSS